MTPTRLPFSRYEFVEFIDREEYHSAVEVGVNLGQFSYYLLKHSKIDFLLSIDAYRGKYKKAMKGAQSLLQPYIDAGRCELLRQESVQAARDMRNLEGERWLDFVYIDANHHVDWVAADLEAWAPLVRPGGILAGHDYCDAHRGVIQAVNKFASRTGWEFSLTREAWASFVFRIPENSRETLAAIGTPT